MITSHWNVTPAADARTWVPLARRGVPARGHDLTSAEACRVCKTAPLIVPVAPVKLARVRHQTRARALRARDIDAVDVGSCTTRQVILLAAARLSLTAHDVHALDLVVAAWRLSPRSFGFTVDGVEYPHTNRVLSKLSGADSLTSLGWLLLDGTSTYRVTERGRSAVLDLAARRA